MSGHPRWCKLNAGRDKKKHSHARFFGGDWLEAAVGLACLKCFDSFDEIFDEKNMFSFFALRVRNFQIVQKTIKIWPKSMCKSKWYENICKRSLCVFILNKKLEAKLFIIDHKLLQFYVTDDIKVWEKREYIETRRLLKPSFSVEAIFFTKFVLKMTKEWRKSNGFIIICEKYFFMKICSKNRYYTFWRHVF